MGAISRWAPRQLFLFTGAALALVGGASLNVQERSGQMLPLAMLAGVFAIAAGVIYRRWRFAAGFAVGAVLVELLIYRTHFGIRPFGVNFGGLVMLGLGGLLGTSAYISLTAEIRRRLAEAEELNARVEEQRRAFLAATEEMAGGDVGVQVERITKQMEAQLGCLYLGTEPDQFVPQPPGVGMDRLRPQIVTIHKDSTDPVLAAIEKDQVFVASQSRQLSVLFQYVPPDLALESGLVVPMRVGEHIGGFVFVGNKPGGFTADDTRLAMTLTMRMSVQLATAHQLALSKKEAARYALLNDLVKEASGKTQEDVFRLVLEKCRYLITYDAGRIAAFQPDGTYLMSGGSQVPESIGGGPLARVKDGETVIRRGVTQSEGLFSGAGSSTEGATFTEALTPIRGKDGVLGAICLGRTGANAFGGRDVPTLEELGAMAGVAVENSRILSQVSGQATKLDTALDALGEVSEALTAVTEGVSALERKTLETAARLTGCTHALMTRAAEPGRHLASMGIGFPPELAGLELKNGQGLIGAVMLGGRLVAVPDATESMDLASPPDLVGLGLHGAICVPMVQGSEVWGTLSVFDGKRREWTEDDRRVLSTLGNQAVVALKNAELYDASQKMIWELQNLHEGLQAATSTLDLDQVLEQVLAGAAKASAAQIGCLALEEAGKLKLVGSYGTDHATAEKLALGLGGDICTEVMSSSQPFMEEMEKESGKEDNPLNPRAVLCVPITLHGKPIGVTFLANYVAGQIFNEDHKRLVTALAAQAAVAIDNARLFRDREEVMLSALKALAAAVDARDPYTAGHSQRVTDYAKVIARQMNYAPDDRGAWRRLEQGTLLHDIGKIGVPDAVLQKPGKLTAEEFEQMKAHPVVGFNILSGLKMLSDELVIVRSHHERFDGKGYPDHKTGEQLPIYAWVVSAADALDAMTSDRPYRKGMSLEVALSEVQKGAGTHFHPDVAEALLDAVQSGALKIEPQESRYKDAPVVGAFENPTG